MKFTLHGYQNDAVRAVLANLKKARKRWREDKDRHAFSLTAVTGAGKTVMAAAVFEALFHGDDGYEFDRDPGAIVIWFSDDPSLNEQTRFRLMESSDKFQNNKTGLVVVENTFNRAKFDAGKIYFLNTQKLGKKSLLVRGFDGDEDGTFPEMRPDLRSHTIWDTIRNTIEDPGLTLYLVLDEAHRGMGAENREKSTIVRRLINGERGVPGIPIVWGISATVERFNRAMDGAANRITLPSVTVDPALVQISGLIKDTIVLDIPDEAGDFDTVLVRRAADKLRESSNEWAAYAAQQGIGTPVLPLMVLQVPNTPNHNDIGLALQTIFQQMPEIGQTCVAHVFGEHTPQTFGAYTVPYIQPQRVQDDTWVRILIAKDAISTGWDCPRAEVMISFRPATDRTYIAQLLGRMVRSPLARRIPGNDRLNAVDCLLPRFDKETVEEVVWALREGGGDMPPTGRILINPVEMKPNPAVPAEVWEKFVSLPSQTRPQRGAKPAVRLTALAHELASDGILPDAGGKAHAAMHKVLDEFIVGRARAFEAARAKVTTVNGRTIMADLRTGMLTDGSFQAAADDAVVDDAYRRAARIISPDIARTYTAVRAKRRAEADEDMDDALMEAREEVAALHLMDNLAVLFNDEATRLADTWFKENHEAIKQLPDDRQEAYRQIAALSAEPQDVDLVRPVSRIERTKIREDDVERDIPAFPKHLLCDEQGNFPVELGTWEREVLETEMRREGFSFWYRNPGRPSQDSLGIAYSAGDEIDVLRPDFIFFAEHEGKIVAEIVDPHGFHLVDSLPKLQGLARYAERHLSAFRRIQAVAKLDDGRLRALDLKDEEVRQAISAATSAKSLYEGATAKNFD
jgi:type III restriction enzyme